MAPNIGWTVDLPSNMHITAGNNPRRLDSGMPKMSTKVRAEIISDLLAAGDGGDIDRLLVYLTDDVQLVFGNADAIEGKEAIKMMSHQFMSGFKRVRHEIHNIWHTADDPDILIAQMTVHYAKFDDSIVSLPCLNVFRMNADLVSDYRIYMDANPIFSVPSAATTAVDGVS
jgi:ketosteroid isomerase-like protein